MKASFSKHSKRRHQQSPAEEMSRRGRGSQGISHFVECICHFISLFSSLVQYFYLKRKGVLQSKD